MEPRAGENCQELEDSSQPRASNIVPSSGADGGLCRLGADAPGARFESAKGYMVYSLNT